MKIDAVLARQPWPWRVVRKQKSMRLYSTPWWRVEDDKGSFVFDDGSCGGEVVFACRAETRDAILELVAAHVERSERKRLGPKWRRSSSEASKEDKQ